MGRPSVIPPTPSDEWVVYRPIMDSGLDSAAGFAPLTVDIQRILSVLLAAQFPGRVQIAKQIESARGRVVDQDGCIAELEIYREDSLPIRGPIHAEALRVLVL